MQLPISVIIPTYNGGHKLPAILKALIHQTISPLEVIVAVDGSTDNSLSVLNEWAQKLPCMRIISQDNQGRAAIRNAGAREARGDLLVFFDDDMRPEPICLAVHALHHDNCPDSILTGAQIDISGIGRSDLQNYKAYLSLKWTEPLKILEGEMLLKENLFLTAANFSIERNLFFGLNGFDAQLTDAEDFDLAARAYEAGVPLYFSYKAFAWHDDPVTGSSYIKRQRQYARAHQLLVTLRPWLAKNGYLKPHHLPVGWKKRVFRLFLSNTWIKAVDKNWLRFLPTPLRYKLYDLIITANGVYYPNKVQLR